MIRRRKLQKIVCPKQKSSTHLEFVRAIPRKQKEKLSKKNLVGFVGDLGLMNYACGQTKVTNPLKIKFIKDNIVLYYKKQY